IRDKLVTGVQTCALPIYWGFDEYDVAAQGQISHHLSLRDGEVDRFSFPFRYVWPSELDLMAQLAGMKLRERWGGWRREPFTSEKIGRASCRERGGGGESW